MANTRIKRGIRESKVHNMEGIYYAHVVFSKAYKFKKGYVFSHNGRPYRVIKKHFPIEPDGRQKISVVKL